ncbi:MAG: proline dehydrogenase family protein [Parcubacteria group bacterium]|nr:proline dehydrogenase family protein [Parcubacteria group bacterium]
MAAFKARPKELISRRQKIRLVKGAYAEGDLGKSETRERIKSFMEQFLLRGNESAIATIKDEELISDILKFASEHGVSKSRFIIQTLYGIGDELKKKWRDEGYGVEVYVPVGPWHKSLPYVWRRIKEILKKY